MSTVREGELFYLSQTVQAAVERYMLSDEDINRCSEQQARAYRQLTTSSERKQIDYSDKAHQGVYIRKFVRAHALMIAQAISLCLPLVKFLADKAEKSLSVTCLGGGPGSDVLGVVHYIDSERIRGVRLQVLILDLVKEWAQAWRKVNNEIAAVHMHSTYAAFDTRSSDDLKGLPSWVDDSELVIMSKFASAIYSERPEPFYNKLFASLPAGCFVVIVDNFSPVAIDRFTADCITIAEKHGCVKLYHENQQSIDTSKYEAELDQLRAEITSSQKQGTHAPMLFRKMLLCILRKEVTVKGESDKKTTEGEA